MSIDGRCTWRHAVDVVCCLGLTLHADSVLFDFLYILLVDRQYNLSSGSKLM